MSQQTKIEWATHTFNPWEGCTKVSPGCAHCYAEARNHRFGMDNWGKGKPRRRTSAATWRNPMKWQREADSIRRANNFITAERPRVFPSLCDWLDDEVPVEWLADFLKLIHDTPDLDWLLLTKRPELFDRRLQDAINQCERMSQLEIRLRLWAHGGEPPRNVWIGVSVEDQKRADERIPELLEIPTAVRFLSVEPLLGPIDLGQAAQARPPEFGIYSHGWWDWVIIGGESGPGARPCNVEWIRDLVRQCKVAEVPCFVKQLGAKPEDAQKCGDCGPCIAGQRCYQQYNVRMTLESKKGGYPSEWPADLRVREFQA